MAGEFFRFRVGYKLVIELEWKKRPTLKQSWEGMKGSFLA